MRCRVARVCTPCGHHTSAVEIALCVRSRLSVVTSVLPDTQLSFTPVANGVEGELGFQVLIFDYFYLCVCVCGGGSVCLSHWILSMDPKRPPQEVIPNPLGTMGIFSFRCLRLPFKKEELLLVSF